MKKLLLSLIIGIMVLLPMSVKADEKVKVYVFEAGGCPYCELEIEYLESLSSYGEKFEIVRKELYVDHVDWQKGKDYDLGVKTVNAFLEAGFANASYQGTPFVVISNIYAATAYNNELEAIIDQAYEDGDNDVVTCLENDGSNCMENAKEYTQKEGNTEKEDILPLIGLGIIVVGLIVIIYLARKSNKEEEMLDKAFADEDEEVLKAEVKKAMVKPVKVVAESKKKTQTKKVPAKKKESTKVEAKGKAKASPKASKSKKTTKSTKKASSKK